jgi:hypothetical protein
MEEWNAGILGIKAEVNHFNCKKTLFLQLCSGQADPSFHYSNWGEAPKFVIDNEKTKKPINFGRYIMEPVCILIPLLILLGGCYLWYKTFF